MKAKTKEWGGGVKLKYDADDRKILKLKKDYCEAEGQFVDCGFIPGRSVLEDCHIHSRRHGSIRHDPRNHKTLCPVHHDFFEANPKLWIEFIGEDLYFELKRLAFNVRP